MSSLREDEMNSELDDSDIDDVDEFGDSGEDWTPEVESESKRKRSTRTSHGSAKKKRRRSSSFDSEQDPDEEEAAIDDDEDDDGVVVEVPIEGDQSITIPPLVQPIVVPQRHSEPSLKDIPREFHSGNFIILKKDVKWDGDMVITKLSDLTIWKIDGKALLQKFVAFEKNGRTLHKATCVYSGWNPDCRDKYYPVSQLLDRNPKIDSKEVCVALDTNDLIKVKDNS